MKQKDEDSVSAEIFKVDGASIAGFEITSYKVTIIQHCVAMYVQKLST